MEDDSDSSPSRRQRLEEAKQQRKARHRSHGPLLPTIEDSSEEDELREEEELLREQEKMRDLEQQRIRSTARKTKRGQRGTEGTETQRRGRRHLLATFHPLKMHHQQRNSDKLLNGRTT